MKGVLYSCGKEPNSVYKQHHRHEGEYLGTFKPKLVKSIMNKSGPRIKPWFTPVYMSQCDLFFKQNKQYFVNQNKIGSDSPILRSVCYMYGITIF